MNKSSILALIILIIPFSALAGMKCGDFEYGTDNYHDNMDELARRASLPDEYYNKYHEEVVSDLCNGNAESVNQAIDDGYVKRSEVEAIREVLGLEKRSSTGKAYGTSREKFVNMGLCNACADNVAQYFVHKPNSKCGKLAKQALEGNTQTIELLRAFPYYCTWNY